MPSPSRHTPVIADINACNREKMIHELEDASILMQIEGREHRDPSMNYLAREAENAADALRHLRVSQEDPGIRVRDLERQFS